MGDRVRLIGIPPDAHDDEELNTRTLFEQCVGKIFEIGGLETVEGLPFELLRLDVGQVIGQAAYMQTIWVEPQYVERVVSE